MALLGDRHEFGRRDRSELGVGPAGERLERAQPIRLEVEDRLVGQPDLIADRVLGQRALDRGAPMATVPRPRCLPL
jgi:hypothetical protein